MNNTNNTPQVYAPAAKLLEIILKAGYTKNSFAEATQRFGLSYTTRSVYNWLDAGHPSAPKAPIEFYLASAKIIGSKTKVESHAVLRGVI